MASRIKITSQDLKLPSNNDNPADIRDIIKTIEQRKIVNNAVYWMRAACERRERLRMKGLSALIIDNPVPFNLRKLSINK